MNTKRTCKLFTLMAGGLFVLAGCGGSGGGVATGTLNIALTDGPVDADEVVIQFTGLEIKPAGGPPETFDLDEDSCPDFGDDLYCNIDLLALRGAKSTVLLEEVLPAGEYQWVRLLVNAAPNFPDSYVTLKNGTECPLWIPSGAETGLKIVSGITVTANGVSNYVLDFDATKSVTAPPGLPSPIEECLHDYILKPAIRIVDETESGSIAGTFSADLLTDADGCEDVDPADGTVDSINVYVFEDFPEPAVADDYDGVDDPITSVTPEWDATAEAYTYEVGYLLEGDYILGLTCRKIDDDLEVDNFNCEGQTGCAPLNPPFTFIDERDASVVADTVANGDFPAPANATP